MSEATNQLLDDAHKALQWLLNNIRQDAPQLSGKAMGNAERVITAIDAALSQPAPSPQPAVPVVSDDILIEREYERVMGQHLRPQDRAGVLKVCRAIIALRPAGTLTGCNCRWDGEAQIEWCELHLAHKDAIHDWAERAKSAEQKLAMRPAVEPMTEWEIADIFERWDNTSGASMSDFVRMVEAHHGITAKAEDAHQPTKEAEKP